MKMSRIMEQLPQPLLTEIIKNEPISTFLRQDIPLAQIMLSEETFKLLVQAMKPWEKQTLQLIVGKFAALPFNLLNLLAVANEAEISGAELIAGIAGLRRKGIIFAISKHWGENSYSLPEDLLHIWQDILMIPSIAWERVSDSDVQTSMEEPKLVLNNLFCFLNYLDHQEVILTQKAEIPKRQIPKIAEKLQLIDSELIRWRINPKYLSVYPYTLALTMDIAERLHLSLWTETRICLCRNELNKWLELSQAEMNKQIFRLFYDVFVPISAGNQHFLTKISFLPFHNWYLIEDFTSWLREYDIIILFTDWMESCEAFGWIEQGLDHSSRGIFRLSINQESSIECLTPTGKFYVQPDYEILVPPDVSYAVRWELTYISDHIHTEQIGIYRLTELSLQRALQSGKSLDYWLDFLNEHSFYGVPESMLYVLKQWGRAEVFAQKIALVENDGFDFTSSENDVLSDYYEFAADIPSRDEVYPAWQTIPPLWWKDCRVYHASTRKEIVLLAIKWKAILKLIHHNKEWKLIPKQVQEHDEGWNLLGWVEADLISYSQDQWQAMQLILPGFEDLTN
jgi:hypothetical protein